MTKHPIKWARERRESMSTAARLVLLLLADNFSTKMGCAWPAVATLEADSGLSRRRVFEALNELYELGLVHVKQRRHKSSYYFLISDVELVDQREEDYSPEMVQNAAPIDASSVRNGSPHQCDMLHPETQGETQPNNNNTRRVTSEGGTSRSRAPSRSGEQQGSRLPDDWVPPQAGIAFAREQGMTDEEIDFEAAQFRDYWCAIPGQRGRKRDWLATWRTWVRKATKHRQRGAGQQHAGGNRQSSGSVVEAVRQSVNARRDQGNS